MFLVLLTSALLIVFPIFVVQYQRYLASLPALDYTTPDRPTISNSPHPKEDSGYDGAASDSASEGPSESRPNRAATSTGHDKRESRKPWDPPFPRRARTVREPYLILPSTSGAGGDERGKVKGKERERRSTSQVAPEEEDMVAHMGGHVPVTDPPSNRAPPPPLMRPPAPVESPQGTASEGPIQPAQSAPPTAPAATTRGRALSLVQTIVLVLIFIIFVFAFAILVAHCIAWFVVYKTEARLGEVRKGLLRGGDMRVCLCAR